MITINLFYKGKGGSAKAFAEEMEKSGIADRIRAAEGNMGYRYFMPFDDPETVLLIDSWRDEEALERHHQSEMMLSLSALREKYDLHMTANRYISDENAEDEKYLRK